MIDLRSDTVTRPGPAMRQAMHTAEVGDEIWGDDPTTNHFCKTISERLGKEAALFMPSGTQSNLAAIMAHCDRGDEYIVGQEAHTYRCEGGGAAVLASVQPQPIENAPDGSLPLDRITAAIKPVGDHHFPRTRLLALENTIDGKVLPQDYVLAAATLARRHGLATHLDGARLFNAAVASGRSAADLCAPFDTVAVCLSKGLGAPVGSVLAGRAELIARAARWRKTLGGGMRQTGLLAAACLYALDHNVDRLAEDHANAARLASGLAGLGLTIASQATNMVFVRIPPAHVEALQQHLTGRGILIPVAPVTRLVTHLDVSRADIDAVISAMRAFFIAAK